MEQMTSFAARSLADAFTQCAAMHGEREVVVASDLRGGRFRLAAIDDAARRLATTLRARGIGKGDIIALQLPGWSEWLIAASAIARCGAVILPVVMIYGARELGFILDQTKARAIISPARWRNADPVAAVRAAGALPDLHTHIVIGGGEQDDARIVDWDDALDVRPGDDATACAPDDLAMLIYTSGTTSAPKGVRHSARTILSETFAVSPPRPDGEPGCFLSPWPPGHVAGITPLLAFLATGRKLVLIDQWDADLAARLVASERVTVSSFTPFHLSGLIEAVDRAGADITTLVECSVGAAPVAAGLVARCEDMGLRIFHRYGATEHPSVTAGTPADPLDKRLRTEGRPMAGNALRIVDEQGRDLPPGSEGEIVTRGPERFLGYLDPALDEDAMLPGGWYRTGDIGRIDAEGYLHLTDRKKDVIIRGGENISSREVEDVLIAHATIAEAAVVARPDAVMGERACAFVVTHGGAQITLEDIRAHFAAAGIARQKTPEHLVLVNELPRNATGKVLKHELRARAREIAARAPEA